MSRKKRRPSLNAWPYMWIVEDENDEEFGALKTDYPTKDEFVAAFRDRFPDIAEETEDVIPLSDCIREAVAWIGADRYIYWVDSVDDIPDAQVRYAYPVWVLDVT